MNFNDAILFSLEAEVGGHANGGYTNDPDDPGGETKWGISKRAYPHLDIKNLTKQEAIAIYKRDYWVAAECHVIPAQFRLAHFDMAINSGVGAAKKLLQKFLKVKQDGQIGPITLKAAKDAAKKKLALEDFLAERLVNYTRICLNRYKKFKRDNPDASDKRALAYALKYSRGWSKRPLHLLSYMEIEK